MAKKKYTWGQGYINPYSGWQVASPSPAAAPAPAPAPAPPPPTFDPYGDLSYAAGASAQTNLETHAGAEHDYQVGAGAQQYGYDANGNLITAGDANFNPYNAAQILKRNYDNSVRGTDNSYAAQGQLYSGARLNAQDTNTYNYGQGSDQLQRGAQSFYHGNDQTLQGIKDQGMFTIANLLGPAFQAWLQSQRGY